MEKTGGNQSAAKWTAAAPLLRWGTFPTSSPPRRVKLPNRRHEGHINKINVR
jgi:hypothetical protein